MKKEIAKKWTEALRSGKYKQGVNKLRTTNDNFCCLGVLCDLAVKEEALSLGFSSGIDRVKGHYLYDGDSTVLPLRVMDWAGMVSTKGYYPADGFVGGRLTTDNDTGRTFEEIADIIEKNWEHL